MTEYMRLIYSAIKRKPVLFYKSPASIAAQAKQSKSKAKEVWTKAQAVASMPGHATENVR